MNALDLPLSPSPLPAAARPRYLVQLLAVGAAFAATAVAANLAGLRFAGATAVVVGATAAIVATRRDGGGAALGLVPASPTRLALWSLAGMLLAYLGAGLATVLATKGLGWPPMRTAALGALHGDVPALLGMLAIAWTTAAVGEELLFRGFLQGRLHALFGGGRGAGIAAVLAQAAIFGLAHAYQGPTGILVTGTVGLVFGLVFLRARTLWPLMVAHGLVDTVGLLALYAGLAPASQ